MIQIDLQILNGRDRTLHFLLYHYFCYFLSLSRSFLVVSVKFEEIKLAPITCLLHFMSVGLTLNNLQGSHLVRPPYCFNLKCKSNSPHGTAAQPFSAGFCFNFFCYLRLRLAHSTLFRKNFSFFNLSIFSAHFYYMALKTLASQCYLFFSPPKLKRRYLSAKNDIVEFTI